MTKLDQSLARYVESLREHAAMVEGSATASADEDEIAAFSHHVEVANGFVGVTKIAGQLRQRGADIVRYEARATVSAAWTVEYICVGTARQIQMWRKYIYRLPEVTRIKVRKIL